MKSLLPVFYWSLPVFACIYGKQAMAQAGDSSNINASVAKLPVLKPEILSNGFIDVINNGQINASARLIRLYIGEPGKFAIPLSFYSGVSANNFQNTLGPSGPRTNDQLVIGFINPLSGLINISAENVVYFKKAKSLTKTGMIYHTGARILTGYKTGNPASPQAGNPVNFLNFFGATGLYFQTGAWEKNNSRNLGLFWVSFRYISCYTDPHQLQVVLGTTVTNGIYYGYCIGSGIEINNLVNLKIFYYRYNKEPEFAYSLSIYQFSFNYSMR